MGVRESDLRGLGNGDLGIWDVRKLILYRYYFFLKSIFFYIFAVNSDNEK